MGDEHGWRWPEGVRAAVALTFDVDGESSVLFDAPDAARRLSVMSTRPTARWSAFRGSFRSSTVTVRGRPSSFLASLRIATQAWCGRS